MKTTAITLVAALTTAGIGFASTARAENYTPPQYAPPNVSAELQGYDIDRPAPHITRVAMTTTTSISSSAMSNIEVTGRPLPANRAPVGVRGTVVEAHNGSLLLQRPDGLVRANIPRNASMISPTNSIVPLRAQFHSGDNITVYGKLDKSGNILKVKAEVIYKPTSYNHATLFMVEDAPLPMMAKFNLQPSAQSALRSYQAHYQPL